MTTTLKTPETVAATLRQLHADAIHSTHERIEADVTAALAGLNLGEQMNALRLAGYHRIPRSMAAIRRRVIARCSERLGRWERGEEIGKVARGEF